MSLQHRLSTLAASHSTCNSTISAQKNQISDLLYQIENVSNSSQGEIIRLDRKLEEAEREWRWAREGREKAEAKLGLARQEIDGLRMKVSCGVCVCVRFLIRRRRRRRRRRSSSNQTTTHLASNPTALFQQ